MMICGVSPLKGFHAVRRGIGHLVPILGGRRLAGLVRVGGGACPPGGCQGWYGGQLIDPVPTPHGALGGRQASAEYGPASDASASIQPSEGRMKAGWPPRDTTSRWYGAVSESWNRWALPALLALASTSRCRASRSSKRLLRRGASSVTVVSGYRATGGRDHTSRDRNKEKFLHVRRTCDHVRLTCPPILSLVQKSCIDQRRTTSFAKHRHNIKLF